MTGTERPTRRQRPRPTPGRVLDAQYLGPVRVLQTLDRDEIARLRASGEFFWLDLVGPSPEDVDALGEAFGFHELALEDTKKFGQRPKLDDYADHVQLVFYGVERDGEPGGGLV